MKWGSKWGLRWGLYTDNRIKSVSDLNRIDVVSDINRVLTVSDTDRISSITYYEDLLKIASDMIRLKQM